MSTQSSEKNIKPIQLMHKLRQNGLSILSKAIQSLNKLTLDSMSLFFPYALIYELGTHR